MVSQSLGPWSSPCCNFAQRSLEQQLRIRLETLQRAEFQILNPSASTQYTRLRVYAIRDIQIAQPPQGMSRRSQAAALQKARGSINLPVKFAPKLVKDRTFCIKSVTCHCTEYVWACGCT